MKEIQRKFMKSICMLQILQR